MSNEKDFTEKILFDLPDVFADIFNVLLFEGKQIIKPEDLVSDGTVSQLKIANDLHMQERDVSKIWTKGNILPCVKTIQERNSKNVERSSFVGKKKESTGLEENSAKSCGYLSGSLYWAWRSYGGQSNGAGRCHQLDHRMV